MGTHQQWMILIEDDDELGVQYDEDNDCMAKQMI